MLVIGRKQGEHIKINDDITIKIVKCNDGDLRIGIEAPLNVIITRGEVIDEERTCKEEKQI